MKKESPKSLKQLLRLITPPKGVTRKNQHQEVPFDEGLELFDCEGESAISETIGNIVKICKFMYLYISYFIFHIHI